MVVNGAAPSLLGGPATYPLAVLAGPAGPTDEADAWFPGRRGDRRPALVGPAAGPRSPSSTTPGSSAAAGRSQSASGSDRRRPAASAAAVAREVGMPHVEERATTGWT